MLFEFDNTNGLTPLEYYDYADFNGKEKDLENLLAENLSDLYTGSGQLMPIFQERQRQPEPDLCALSKEGDLIIFELKRGEALEGTTIQIMRYSEEYGQFNYRKLNELYKKYTNTNDDLAIKHANNFGLEKPLLESEFNKHQKLVIIGSSSDTKLISAVEYWKNKNLDIDFLPYRFYEIGEKRYFEFFAKPYDYHINPRDKKGVLFDTNKSYNENDIWDMFDKSKISAYGNASKFVNYLNAGDYVFYYHVGYGVVGVGMVKNQDTYSDPTKEEQYKYVNLITPKITCESEIRYLSCSELSSLLNGQGFFYARTVKTPYLSIEQSEIVVDALKEKYDIK